MKRFIVSLVTWMSIASMYGADNVSNSFIGYGRSNHFCLGVSAGTTGVGLDFAITIKDYVRVRYGNDFTPRFGIPMSFNITSYTDGKINNSNFETLRGFMKDLTGFDVDSKVEMRGKACMFNCKFLVDIYPLKENRHWYLTAGFYFGSSKVGHVENTIQEMPSLLAIQMYNKMYDYVTTTDFMDTPIYNDIYLDPDVADELKEKFTQFGRIGVHVGDRKSDKSPYMMEPGKDGMVKADMLVNRFKPYVGLGYNTSLTKDKRLNMSVDCGVLMWGGTPRIVTHELVDLSKDVDDISGKVGRYVRLAKSLKVYPMLNFRLSYRLY